MRWLQTRRRRCAAAQTVTRLAGAELVLAAASQVEFVPLVKLEEVKTQTMEEDEECLFKMYAAAAGGVHCRLARAEATPPVLSGVRSCSGGSLTPGRRR